MANEGLNYLLVLTIATSAAIVAAMMARLALRHFFGAAAAYTSWLFVPIALVAACLPHFSRAGSALAITLKIGSRKALSHSLDASLASSFGDGSLLHWPTWTLAAWGLGAILSAAYLAGVQRAFLMSLGVLTDSRRVLRAQHSAGCPALLGVIRPKIVLPPDFSSKYTRSERLLIFAHERTHLRRGDFAWNAFAALLRCLLWFNPLVYAAATYFRVDQELACDAAVLRDHPGSRRVYAQAMLKTELTDLALPLGCHWNSVKHLKERLKMLKLPTPGLRRRVAGQACITLASVAVGFTAWAIAPAPRAADHGVLNEAAVVMPFARIFIGTVDDRRILVGVSKSNDDTLIDELFLYTSQRATGMRITLDNAASEIDYHPKSGLRLSLWDLSQNPNVLTFFLSAGGGASTAGTDSAHPFGNPLGTSLGLSRYSMHPALSVKEILTLHKADQCRGVQAPCVWAAGHLLPFPG